MTLGKLIGIADKAYTKYGLVQKYFDNPGGDFGDSLALFIAHEIKDTYDSSATDEEQLEAAMSAMRGARDQLGDVIKAFAEHF